MKNEDDELMAYSSTLNRALERSSYYNFKKHQLEAIFALAETGLIMLDSLENQLKEDNKLTDEKISEIADIVKEYVAVKDEIEKVYVSNSPKIVK